MSEHSEDQTATVSTVLLAAELTAKAKEQFAIFQPLIDSLWNRIVQAARQAEPTERTSESDLIESVAVYALTGLGRHIDAMKRNGPPPQPDIAPQPQNSLQVLAKLDPAWYDRIPYVREAAATVIAKVRQALRESIAESPTDIPEPEMMSAAIAMLIVELALDIDALVRTPA